MLSRRSLLVAAPALILPSRLLAQVPMTGAGLGKPASGGGATTTLDPATKSAGIVLLNGDLTAVGSSGSDSVPSIAGHTSGKYYMEWTVEALATYSEGMGIISTNTHVNLANIGNDGYSGGRWVGDSAVYCINNTNVGTTGFTVSTGDIMGMAVDLGNKTIWYRKNGGNWNNNGAYNPSTNTGGIDISSVVTGPSVYAYTNLKSAGTTITANFGATAYNASAPSGFGNW